MGYKLRDIKRVDQLSRVYSLRIDDLNQFLWVRVREKFVSNNFSIAITIIEGLAHIFVAKLVLTVGRNFCSTFTTRRLCVT